MTVDLTAIQGEEEMRLYHMNIEHNGAWDISPEERRVYISKHQGAAPEGWHCVAVCGYHDVPGKTENNEDER